MGCCCSADIQFDEAAGPAAVNKHFEEPKQVTVMKGTSGLGVRMGMKDGMVILAAFKQTDGLKGAAERSGKVKVGDAILAVGGVDVPRLDKEAGRAAALARVAGDAAKRANLKAEYAFADEAAAAERLAAGLPAEPQEGEEGGAGESDAKGEADLKACVGMLRDAPAMVKLTILPCVILQKDVEQAKRRKNSLAKAIVASVDPEKQVDGKDPDAFHNPAPRDHWEEAVQKVQCGSLEAAKDEVIFHWSRINRQTNDLKDTLCHILCREGYVLGARFLLDPSNHAPRERVRLQVAVRNKMNRTPLMLCFSPLARTGNAKGRTEIEDKAPNDVWMEPGDERERTEIVQCLIRAGADVHEEDMGKWTPVMMACAWGWHDCVRILLRSGAKAERLNGEEQSCLHLACKYGHEEVALLLARGTEEEPDLGLPKATLKLLMGKQDANGNTPFHYACRTGLDELVEHLLDTGVADAMAPNKKDQTPLKLAIKNGRARAASILLHIPTMMRRKSAIACATGETAEYLAQRQKEGAYKRPDPKDKASKKKYKRGGGGGDGGDGGGGGGGGEAKVDYAKQGDWEEFSDPYKGNQKYYFNHKTKESRWDPPEGFVLDPKNMPRILGIGEKGLWPQYGTPEAHTYHAQRTDAAAPGRHHEFQSKPSDNDA